VQEFGDVSEIGKRSLMRFPFHMSRGPALMDIDVRIRSLNTAPITREAYAGYYWSWGGSFILHPEVLQFFEDIYGITTHYRGYFRDEQCVGAVGTWGPYIAGDFNAFRTYKLEDQVDFGYPILYLPIAPGHKCAVHYRAGFLLNYQRHQIPCALFTGIKEMSILRRIPQELPACKSKFQSDERRFERLGGTVRDIKEFRNDEIIAIYEDLFHARWKCKPHAIATLKGTLDRLQQFLFGKVLWLKNRAVAIQINYRAETSRTICVDAINGGVDKSVKEISPGSLLLYINGRDACADAHSTGKQLIYSYGKSNAGYKDQWCVRIARGFTGFWFP
jgi:Mig-14